MISSKFIIVAENIIKDTDTNSFSVINILEDITAESFPIVIQRIAIVAYLEKSDDDDDKASVRLKVSNNAIVLTEHVIKSDFRGKNKNRTVVRVGGILFPEPGVAKFEIFEIGSDRLIGDYTLYLKLRDPVQVT